MPVLICPKVPIKKQYNASEVIFSVIQYTALHCTYSLESGYLSPAFPASRLEKDSFILSQAFVVHFSLVGVSNLCLDGFCPVKTQTKSHSQVRCYTLSQSSKGHLLFTKTVSLSVIQCHKLIEQSILLS